MPVVWEIIRYCSYIDEKASDGTIDIPNLVSYTKKFMEYINVISFHV